MPAEAPSRQTRSVSGDDLQAGARDVRWEPPVSRQAIWRLYTTDAKGILDEDLIDEVGYGLYARCESILSVTAAHRDGNVTCPRCSGKVVRRKPIRVASQVLRCDSCGWATTWGAYHATYRGGQLTGGSAVDAFAEFVDRFPRARTPRAKLLEIDRLIHRFHHERVRSTRPVGINLIEGSLAEVLDLLQRITDHAPGAEESRTDAIARARLGNRIRLLRAAAGLTGRELGGRVGLSASQVSMIETGRVAPSGEATRRLARALGATPDEEESLAAEARALTERKEDEGAAAEK